MNVNPQGSFDPNLKYLIPGPNYWVLDLEADDLEASTIWCVVVSNVITKQTLRFYGDERRTAFNDWLTDTQPTLVGHNIISFDAPTLNRLWGSGIALDSCVDTLVLSFLDDPKRDKGHSLDAWGERLGFLKTEFNDWTQFSPQMLEYCVNDVELTRQLYLHLCKIMEDFSEQSAQLEHRTRRIIDDMQRNGVRFDVEGAKRLHEHLRGREAELGEQIHRVFPAKLVVAGVYDYRTKKDGSPYSSYLRHLERYDRVQFNRSGTRYRVFERRPFNIGSPAQRVERLLEVGWKPTQFTPKGNPKVDEESLVAFAKKSGNEAAQHMADWLVCNGRANMLENWMEYVDDEHRIHPRVFSCGAGSRRMRHTKPNTANIPGLGAPYGAECRALWTVGVGRKLVGCDAKGLEGRVLVHYLGNDSAKKFFLESDPHQSNADAIGCERGPAKNFFYAFLYGASDRKLGSMAGKGAPEGARIRNALKGNIPGLKELVASTEREYQDNNGLLRTIDGGFVRCPSPHAALNYKFQSAGSLLMKQAAVILDDWVRGFDAFKVLDVHDEWQFDVREDQADEVGQLMVRSIRRAGEVLEFNIEMDGDYKIGDNWAATH